MDIGIIGAGNIGGTLTRRLTAIGHNVFVANSRGPETLADLARETGARPVTQYEAARRGEIVIVIAPPASGDTRPSADEIDGMIRASLRRVSFGQYLSSDRSV